MRKLSLAELKRISPEEFKNALKTPIIVVLDNVRSLNNIGSVFRSCDAFRIEGIYLCGVSGTPPHKEIHKTALGATETVDWKYFEETSDAIDMLKKASYKIYAVEQADKSIGLNDFNPSANEKISLIFGNEVNGVDETIMKVADGCLEIPQYGTKHSLNIAVTAGIVLWELFRKMNLSDKS